MKSIDRDMLDRALNKFVEEYIKENDLEKVRHAHWNRRHWQTEWGDSTPAYYICSNCDRINDSSTSYCPWCGALMDGKE